MKTITAPAPYGYQELRLLHQRYMTLAMLVAVTIQMMAVGGYHFAEWLKPPPPKLGNRGGGTVIDLGNIKPPPLHNFGLGAIPFIPEKLVIGSPVPVPDAVADTNSIFASQKQISDVTDREFGKYGEGLGDGTITISPDDIDPSPDVFKGVEIWPTPVSIPKPEYPELGIKIDLEGSVIVKALLDKEGRVKKTILVKSSHEMFSQPALDAAQKCVFTPAIMNGNPVPVWVSIPFKFKLTH
jgi:protein TonB